jgi:hypothetical protein
VGHIRPSMATLVDGSDRVICTSTLSKPSSIRQLRAGTASRPPDVSRRLSNPKPVTSASCLGFWPPKRHRTTSTGPSATCTGLLENGARPAGSVPEVDAVRTAMFFLNCANDEDPGMPRRSEISDCQWWNLWTRRLAPFNEMADGQRIVLVDSWPRGGRLTWEIEATNVLKASYGSKRDAERRLAGHFNLPVKTVRSEPYTARGPDSGYVLGLAYQPVRRVDQPRPPGMRFQPNGWLKVADPALLASWGIQARKPTSAHARPKGPQGRGLTGSERDAVEMRAMKVAETWCRQHGWPRVVDVHQSKSWDLEARKFSGTKVLYVEAKGTIGDKPVVEVTASEFAHARTHRENTVLVVVTGIALDRSVPPTASGGVSRAYYPWVPELGEVTPTRYRWSRA